MNIDSCMSCLLDWMQLLPELAADFVVCSSVLTIVTSDGISLDLHCM